jgi:hypothetical protein
MDGPGAGDNLAAMREPLWDEIFLSGFDGDASATNDKGIASLCNDHILVILMHMRRGNGSLGTSPECHLTPIRPVKDVAFYARSGLATRCNLICGTLHELRKIVHRFFSSVKRFP